MISESPFPSSERLRSGTWLRRFSKFTALSTLILIFAGGLVTSTGSGLSVPDWPNTYGYFMFFFPLSKMVGGIAFEHTHRLIASFVGFLTLVLAFWLWKREPRAWVRRLGFAALGAVIAQGLLGGITVLFLLPAPVSIAHGILAQTFFCLTVAIAYFLSREWASNMPHIESARNQTLFKWSVIATVSIYVQLVLGAVMRHTGSGLAILDFPLVNGHVIPRFENELLFAINNRRFELGLDPVTVSQVFIHFVHRVGALFVLTGVIGLAYQVFRYHRGEKRLVFPSSALVILLAIQIALAGLVVWSAKEPMLTTFHVWTGALMLGTSLFVTLRSARLLSLFRLTVSPVRKAGGVLISGPHPTSRPLAGKISAFWELTKPGITGLVLVSTFIGFYLATADQGSSLGENGWLLFYLLLGTALVSGGAGTLNEYMERDHDLLMRRTRGRPVPSGKVTPKTARRFGATISVLGVLFLVVAVSFAAGIVALLTLILYLFLYTPLKRKTTWNTVIGAIPGALPTLGGWIAAHGNLSLAALALFGILFLWQIPHFLSIAWIYRKDYERAGFKMLPVSDEKGIVTGAYVVIFCAALLACSLALTFAAPMSQTYLVGAAMLGISFLAIGVDLARSRTHGKAKRLLMASILYLPLLLATIIIDRSALS